MRKSQKCVKLNIKAKVYNQFSLHTLRQNGSRDPIVPSPSWQQLQGRTTWKILGWLGYTMLYFFSLKKVHFYDFSSNLILLGDVE